MIKSTDSISEEYRRMLEWRGIDPIYNNDIVCPACGGSGVIGYPSTATWRGGIGGQQFTNDVCNKCWGSGKQNKPGVNLIVMFSELRTLSDKLLKSTSADSDVLDIEESS